jgi:hypothetical protein
MKKILLFTGIAAILSLASCKKDWTCQCTDNAGATSYHDVPNATISDANRTCNNFENSNGGSYTNCSIIN